MTRDSLTMDRKLQSSYPPSWYAASTDIPPPRLPIAGAVSCDVCVVGGGLAGLTTALELARRGKQVVLLEANRIGWGASGRNGGFVSVGFAEGLSHIVRRVGLEQAQALFRLSAEGAEYVRAKIEELDPSIHMGDGWIVAVRHPDRDGQRRYVEMLARQFGHELKLLDVRQTRELLKSKRYFDSRLDPSAFHIDPLRYCLAMANAAEKMGAKIYEQSRVRAIDGTSGLHHIRTDAGRVMACHVVFCQSSHDRHLSRPSGRAVLPVATYITVTEPLGDRAGAAIATRAAVADTRRAGNYYRLVGENRLMWGGMITTILAEPRALAQSMKRDMLSVYPQLGNPRMDFAWSGLMGYALHKMPIIGESAPRHWSASGFGGHGLNTTAMAGLLIARAIAEGDDEWRRFNAFGAPWAGGWLGRAGVQLSYWKMQLQDRLDELRAPD
jgi:gamma-glutamylputrescine oxidase